MFLNKEGHKLKEKWLKWYLQHLIKTNFVGAIAVGDLVKTTMGPKVGLILI